MAFSILPGGIPSSEAFGSPRVDLVEHVNPASISSGEAFGTVRVERLQTTRCCHPADRQQSRLIRQSLYALKRQYGGAIQVYRLRDAETDLRTGKKTICKSVFPVRRAVVLPAQLQREVIQSISQISANKKFVQGGTFDRGHRNFIIDARDLPCGFEFTSDDWIVFRNRRYELKQVFEFEFRAGWVVTGREILGRIPEQIFPVKADDLLMLSDEGS